MKTAGGRAGSASKPPGAPAGVYRQAGGAKIQELERQLARVERELRRKDRDTYRRQNAAFTRLA